MSIIESLLVFISKAVFFLVQGLNYLQAQSHALQNDGASSLILKNSFLKITNTLIHKLM